MTLGENVLPLILLFLKHVPSTCFDHFIVKLQTQASVVSNECKHKEVTDNWHYKTKIILVYGEPRHANDYLKTSAYEQFKVLRNIIGALVTQLCLTLQDPLDCSPVSISFLFMGFFQAKEYLYGLSISSCMGSSWPRDGTQASCLSCIVWWEFLIHWAIEYAPFS